MYVGGKAFPEFIILDIEMMRLLIEANYSLKKLNEISLLVPEDYEIIPFFILEATKSIQMDVPFSSYPENDYVLFREYLMSCFLRPPQINTLNPKSKIFHQIKAYAESRYFYFIKYSENDIRAEDLFQFENHKIHVNFNSIRILHLFMNNISADVSSPLEKLSDTTGYQKNGNEVYPNELLNIPENLEEFINKFECIGNDPCIPLIIKIPILCFYLAVCRPFETNNDRFVRLFIPSFMVSTGMLRHHIIGMSTYFDKTQDEFKDAIESCLQKDNLSEWIKYFLKGITNQSVEGLNKINRIHHICQGYKELICEQNKKDIAKIIVRLEYNPYISEKYILKQLKFSRINTDLYLSELLSKGVIQEITQKRYQTRFFCCEALLTILEEKDVISSTLIFDEIMAKIWRLISQGKDLKTFNIDVLLKSNLEENLRKVLNEIKFYAPQDITANKRIIIPHQEEAKVT